MINQENQELKYGKMYILLGLFVLVTLLLVAPRLQNPKEAQTIAARQRAEALGQQLLAHIGSTPRDTYSKPKRGLASDEAALQQGTGYIGLDPWGRPYKYNILKTDQGVARVVLISDGPKAFPSGDEVTHAPDAIKVVIQGAE